MRALILGGPTNNTTRCSANLEADQLFLVAADQAIVAGLQLVCDGTPSPGELLGCAPVALATFALAILEFEAAACALQDGLIDAAEIEAGYENTVKLIALNTRIYEKQIEDNLLACKPVISLWLPESNGGLSEWVKMLIEDRLFEYMDLFGLDSHSKESIKKLDDGQALFDVADYEKAYRKYCEAYKTLTMN